MWKYVQKNIKEFCHFVISSGISVNFQQAEQYAYMCCSIQWKLLLKYIHVRDGIFGPVDNVNEY